MEMLKVVMVVVEVVEMLKVVIVVLGVVVEV